MHTFPDLESIKATYGHVPLVVSTRGQIVESVHYGSFAVVAADGATIFSAGAARSPIYPRSGLKPLQLIAMVSAGLTLPDNLLALGASSHSGATNHQAGTEQILALHGLDASSLRNVPDLPYGPAEREAWLAAGRGPTQLAQDCSGKHAAMLATCVINGWTVDDYLDPTHPLQQLIEATLADLTCEAASASSIDGCGTPLFAYSLHGVARAYARFGPADPDSPTGRVAAAIRRYPEMVAGETRDVTRLMRAVSGLLAKDGAEGVQLVSLQDGTAIALKIADGADRARLPITLSILVALGVDQDLLTDVTCPPPLGGGTPVGELRPAKEITEAMSTVTDAGKSQS